jgi:vesicle coat complex subunit
MDKANKLAFQTDLFKELFKIKKIQNQIAEQQNNLRKQKKTVEKLMKNGANIT